MTGPPVCNHGPLALRYSLLEGMIFIIIINRNSTNSRIICANTYILDKSINPDDCLGFRTESWNSWN